MIFLKSKFANQTSYTGYDEYQFGEYTAKMISTETKGVGINRNLGLMYATADICLFADDDVCYLDDCKEKVLREFEQHPDADIIIFHFDTDSHRKQIQYSKTKKCGRFSRQPWATFRVAFRLKSVRKANISFTTLFGGGCVFPSGEDSMWLNEARKKGLTFYVSKETIGTVSFEQSTWFTGINEKFFYGKGAFYAAVHPNLFFLWQLYFALRTKSMTTMSFKSKMKWINNGRRGYKQMLQYEDFRELDDSPKMDKK